MSLKYKIIDADMEAIEKYGMFCVSNKKHEGYKCKHEWLKKRFEEGLKFYMAIDEETNKPTGFIECIPGKYAWRGVENCENYLFIHCIMVYPKKYLKLGVASALIDKCTEYAKEKSFIAVCVISSDNSWLASKDIFDKNGFNIIEEKKPYQIMIKEIGKEKKEKPRFIETEDRLKKYQNLTIMYSSQCPYLAKAGEELLEVAKEYDVKTDLIKMKNSKDVQNGPTIYGTFCIIYNGKIVAEYYTSKTRFKNILEKELKLSKK